MIYISTGGYSNKSVCETIKYLSEFDLHDFELSGGKYSPSQNEDLKELSFSNNFIVHNYFPPPKDPFVLNLASLDSEIYERSFRHIKSSIKLASQLKSPYYSFHAGFLVDPKVSELGQSVKKRNLFDKNKALKRFISSVNLLSEFAIQNNVKLLIENNVLTKNNLNRFEQNPLLMVDIEGTLAILEKVSKNVGLLIDVAHLKVSARTLDFNPLEFLKIFSLHTNAYHLSDNDGISDSNQLVTKNSWFWPYIKKGLDYYSLEIYNRSPEELVSQLKLARSILN